MSSQFLSKTECIYFFFIITQFIKSSQCFLLFFQTVILHMILNCDAATEEAARTYSICSALGKYNDKDVQMFIKYIKHHKVYFTAASFFEIKRNTILSMVNIVTTYYIVILQLHGIYIHKE